MKIEEAHKIGYMVRDQKKYREIEIRDKDGECRLTFVRVSDGAYITADIFDGDFVLSITPSINFLHIGEKEIEANNKETVSTLTEEFRKLKGNP